MLPEMRKWLGLALVVVILDQITKAMVTARFNLGDSLTVTSFFDLVFVFNRGAAFSFLANAGGWQRWFFVGLAFVICTWLFFMLRHHAREKAMPFAIALIMGGAVGNVIDRFVHGAVVDFLSFHLGGLYWPAFNVADSGITVGVILMVWCQFISGAHDERARQGG